MSVVPGSHLGPYEVVSRIGAGGMGEVWLSADVQLDRARRDCGREESV